MINSNKYDKTYHAKNPWMKHQHFAKQRCNYKNNISYRRYGGRGIKFLLTKEEMKFLWFRDKAHSLKKPSIDRIDNDKNYTLNNCRFIELSENKNKESKRPVANYMFERLVLTFYSIREAARFYKTSAGNICLCCQGKRPFAKGYTWRYLAIAKGKDEK